MPVFAEGDLDLAVGDRARMIATPGSGARRAGTLDPYVREGVVIQLLSPNDHHPHPRGVGSVVIRTDDGVTTYLHADEHPKNVERIVWERVSR